jgi:hypothetical protein
LICYTRNFEDVILQRVFADIGEGCYLDVGASDPISDSNTYAMYKRGWRGIALEPLPFGRYGRKDRPEDLFLNVAVGAQSGQVKLAGLSGLPDQQRHAGDHCALATRRPQSGHPFAACPA